MADQYQSSPLLCLTNRLRFVNKYRKDDNTLNIYC